MFAFASMIFTFLGGPVAKALVNAYQIHATATTTDNQTAAELAGKEIGAQMAETQILAQVRIAEIGHPFEPDKLMGYCVAIYLAKLLIFDKVLGLGITDPLAGWASTTANLIVGAYFGKQTVENIARIIKR